jgi:hypothetical protein
LCIGIALAPALSLKQNSEQLNQLVEAREFFLDDYRYSYYLVALMPYLSSNDQQLALEFLLTPGTDPLSESWISDLIDIAKSCIMAPDQLTRVKIEIEISQRNFAGFERPGPGNDVSQMTLGEFQEWFFTAPPFSDGASFGGRRSDHFIRCLQVLAPAFTELIGQQLDKTQQEECLIGQLQLTEQVPNIRDYVLVQLIDWAAAALSQPMADAVVQRAIDIKDHRIRFEALARLLPYLDHVIYEQAVSWMVEVVENTSAIGERVALLSRLGQYAPKDQLVRALGLTANIEDLQEKAESLAALVPQLPLETVKHVLPKFQEIAEKEQQIDVFAKLLHRSTGDVHVDYLNQAILYRTLLQVILP